MGFIWETPEEINLALFQSTHPVWGGTSSAVKGVLQVLISIHPPRVGWDASGGSGPLRRTDFNPPTPGGVGLVDDASLPLNDGISIHPPRVGWDGA